MTTSKKKRKSKKKAGRFNTRLLLIVGLTTSIVVGIAGGLIFLRMKGSVSRNLHAGQTHLEEGKWEKAERAFGRVVKKDPTNEDGMAGLMQVYDNWVPDTPERGSQLQGSYARAILHDTEYHPSDDDRAYRAMEFLYQEARGMSLDSQWKALQKLADTVRDKFGDDSGPGQRAIYYRALSRLALETESFTRDRDDKGNVIFPGEEELTLYLSLRPGDDEGMAQLAFGRMAVARRLGLDEQFQQEKRNLALAEATFKEALAANPEGPATLLSYIRHLVLHELITVSRQARQVGTLTSEEREAILAELQVNLDLVEELLYNDPNVNPLLLADFFRFVRIGDDKHGEERIRDLAQHYLKTHPDDDLRRLELAESYTNLLEFDHALREVRIVMDAADRPVSKGAALQYLVRTMAASRLLSIASRKWSMSEDDAGRAQAIEDAVEARAALVKQVQGDQDTQFVVEADSRLAFMRGEHRDAARLMDQLSTGGSLSPELLRMNAVSLESIGQPGLAADRLRTAVKLNPVSISSRALLAGLLGRMRQPGEALQVIQVIPSTVYEERPELVSLRQSLHAMQIVESGGDISSVGNPVLEAIMSADKLQREGRVQEAADVLQVVIDSSEDGNSLLPAIVAAAQIESSLGNRDSAISLIDRARNIRPDDDRLKQIQLSLAIDDPIERLRAYVQQSEQDPAKLTITMILAMESLSRAQEAQANRLDRMGETASADAARALAARAEEAAAPLRESLVDVTGVDEQTFLVQFQAVLRDGDLDEAERMLAAGRQNNVDQAGGNLIEAELLLARFQAATVAKDPDAASIGKRAVAAARRSTQEAGWNSGTWRQLGRVLQMTGDIEEARLAWAEAWRRNPTDASTVRAYAQLLLQPGGDPPQAARVLREAAKDDRGDRTLTEDWLAVEGAFGEKAIALVERNQIYNVSPGDRTNAIRLAELLATLEPTFELMASEETTEPLTARQWLAMSTAEQQTSLDKLSKAWAIRAGEICDQLALSDDAHLQHMLLHAGTLRDLGRRQDMLARLARFVDRTDDSPERDRVQEVLSAAQFLIASDREWEAGEFLRARLHLQGPDRHLEGALGTVLASIGKPADAVPLLRGAVDAGRTNLRPRLIEVLLQLHRIDAAEAVLADEMAASPTEYRSAMLQALIARAKQGVAEGQGDQAARQAAQVSYREFLEEASRRDPEQVAPYLELIASMIREYRRTIDRSTLENALRYADAAAEIRSDVAPLAIQRAMVLEALGEPRKAATGLESFLRRAPDADEVRVTLAQMHIAAGTPERARTVLEGAVVTARNPSAWRQRLAEHIMEQNGDRVEATALMAKAWQDEPTSVRLNRLCDLTRTHEPWDHEAVYKAIQARPSELKESPVVRGLQARALSVQGLRDHARESLREAWIAYQRSLAEGAIPPEQLRRWFEDVYVVFRGTDTAAADSFIVEVTESSTDPFVLAGRAHFLSLRGNAEDYAKAIQLVQQVLTTKTGSARLASLSQLGAIQLRSGRESDAVDTFSEVVELDPNNPVALNNVAWLLATLQDNPTKALPLALRAVELDSTEPTFMDTVTEVQRRLGNHEAAMTSRLSMLRLQPNNPDLLKNVAEAYLEHFSDAQAARPYAERALQLSPRDAAALDLAGWVDFKDGKVARAEDRLKQSIRRAPSAQAHLHLAQVLADQGQRSKALDQLRQADALSKTPEMQNRVKSVRDHLEGTG